MCARDTKEINSVWSVNKFNTVEFFILCLETRPTVLADNGGLMIGEIVVIMEPVHLVVQCTGVVFLLYTAPEGIR